jgi:hypothetical protein
MRSETLWSRYNFVNKLNYKNFVYLVGLHIHYLKGTVYGNKLLRGTQVKKGWEQLFNKEIMAVYCKNTMEHTNTVRSSKTKSSILLYQMVHRFTTEL